MSNLKVSMQHQTWDFEANPPIFWAKETAERHRKGSSINYVGQNQTFLTPPSPHVGQFTSRPSLVM